MKDHILSEIARLAKETGRVPGKVAFTRETGIRTHQWEGVHWARWSDALREAGLSPNEMQGRLATEDVLIKVAEASRYYKRFPSSTEMRLYGRQNSGFPSHGTIANHFETRRKLLDAFRSFVDERPEYHDVAAYLPVLARVPHRRPEKIKEGLVYLLKSGMHFKIGRSNHIERRVKQITISLPESVELIHTIRTDDPAGIEAYWHKRFADLRANGEWFKLGSGEVAAFRRRNYQ